MKRNLLVPLILAFALSTSAYVFAAEDGVTAASDAVSGASAAATPAPAPAPVSAPASTPAPARKATPAPAAVKWEPVIAANGEITYTVVPGDTLSHIATRFGVKYPDIAALNKIPNVHLIYPGQVFVIPGTKAEPTPEAEEAPAASEQVPEPPVEEEPAAPELVPEPPAEEEPAAPETPVVELEPDVETPDAVTGASEKESSDPDALVAGLSEDGFWIFSILSDVAVEGDVHVDGTFFSKDDETAKIYRKLALYAQDEDHNVTAEYTLTLDNMFVTSPNFRIQNGTVVGDIYVNAEGFELSNATVEGNVYFATEALQATALLETATIQGEVGLGAITTTEKEAEPEEVDVVTSASPKESADPEDLIFGLSEQGSWIFSVLDDVTIDGDLSVDGTFHDKEDETAKLYRKLALYAQDEERNVTAEYVLTVDKMVVNSPNFRIQNGTVVGDIYVNAEGFELYNTTVEGNVYFATEALQAAALLETATIEGEVGLDAAPPIE